MINQRIEKLKLKRGKLKTNYLNPDTGEIDWTSINPEEGELIFDIDDKILYVGDGTGKQIPIQSGGGGGNQVVQMDTVPPENPVEGQLWIDTNQMPFILRTWNGSQWVTTGGGLDRQLQDALYQSVTHHHDTRYQQLNHQHNYTDIDFTGSTLKDIQKDIPDYTLNNFRGKFLRINDNDEPEWQQIVLTLNDLQDSPYSNIYSQGNENQILRIKSDLSGWEVVKIENIDIPQLQTKQDDLLTFYNKDPEKLLTSDLFDVPNGIPQLDSFGKIKYSQIPDELKSITVVDTVQDMEQITDQTEGMRVFVVETNSEYIYDQDNATWVQLTGGTQVILNWDNILGKPVSSPDNIDDQVNKRHEHQNKTILDQIELPFTQQIYNTINQKLDKDEQQNTYIKKNDPIYLSQLPEFSVSNPNENEQLVYRNGYFRNVRVVTYDSLSNINVGQQDLQNDQLQLGGQPQDYYQKKIKIQSTEPLDSVINDLWIDITDATSPEFKVKLNTGWVKVQSGITSNAIDNITLKFNENGKLYVQDNSHLHTKDNITDFQHTHTRSDITDFQHTHSRVDLIDFQHTHSKQDITDFQHTHNPDEIILDENHRFVTDSDIQNWNQKQDKDGTLQVNLNQEMLNGQKLDNSVQSSTTIWDSLKVKTYVDQFIQGITYLPAVIDFLDNPTLITPQEGDRYIVGQNQVDVFSGHTNEIQTYTSGSWNFEQVQQSNQVQVKNQNSIHYFNGTEWIEIMSVISHNTLGGIQGGNGVDEYYHLDYTTYTKLISGFTTDDIIEGSTNKYFTDQRQKQVIQNFINQTPPLSFDIINGTISINQQSETSDGYMEMEDKYKLNRIDLPFIPTSNDYQLVWDTEQGKFIPKQILQSFNQTEPLIFDPNTLTLSINYQNESQDGVITKEDKFKLNRLMISQSDIIQQMNENIDGQQLILSLVEDPDLGQIIKLQPLEQKTSFIELTDTPELYEDSKFLKVDVDHLVFTDITWEDISNKPESNVQDIDDQVVKRHSHSNLDTLNQLTQSFIDDLVFKQNEQYDATQSLTSIPDTNIEWTIYTPVTQAEKDIWNNKQDQLGFTPENKQEKGQPNGYAPLGSNGKIPDIYLPDQLKTVKVVQTYSDLLQITDQIEGMRVFVQDQYDDPNVGVHESREYIYDAETSSWVMVNPSTQFELTWDNISGKPTSLPTDIDDQVAKRHEHTSTLQDIDDQVAKRHEHLNKTTLDLIPDLPTENNKILYLNSSGNLVWTTPTVGSKEVDETNIQDNRVLVYDQQTNKLIYKNYVSKWEELDKTNQKLYDLPDVDDYSTFGEYFVIVKNDGSGLTYTDVIDGGTW